MKTVVAELSEEQVVMVVERVIDNLSEKKKVKKEPAEDSDSKDEKEDDFSFGDIEFIEPEEEKEPEENEEAAMSDDTDALDKLRKEMEDAAADGKVDSSEVIRIVDGIVEMVDSLLRAKPGRKRKSSSIENRVAELFLATRGQQNQRKDKDLMSDTGGISKGRDREPDMKPPREDMKDNHRTRRKTKSERDTDTDNDKDLK